MAALHPQRKQLTQVSILRELEQQPRVCSRHPRSFGRRVDCSWIAESCMSQFHSCWKLQYHVGRRQHPVAQSAGGAGQRDGRLAKSRVSSIFSATGCVHKGLVSELRTWAPQPVLEFIGDGVWTSAASCRYVCQSRSSECVPSHSSRVCRRYDQALCAQWCRLGRGGRSQRARHLGRWGRTRDHSRLGGSVSLPHDVEGSWGEDDSMKALCWRSRRIGTQTCQSSTGPSFLHSPLC